MTFVDDRTLEQQQSHTVLIAATDSFMSGWGMAKGGASFVAWACKPKDAKFVEAWVNGRKEMKRVRRVKSSWRGKSAAHVHIYVVDDKHPALQSPNSDDESWN